MQKAAWPGPGDPEPEGAAQGVTDGNDGERLCLVVTFPNQRPPLNRTVWASPRACWEKVLPRSPAPGRRRVSIPPTVSTRSRSWKPARPEAGRGARRKKRRELVQKGPPHHRQHGKHRQGTDTDRGGQGGNKGGATVVSSWPE